MNNPSSNSNTPLPNLKRNEKYYLDSGDVHFIVGNEHFKIHSFFLERDSVYFRERVFTTATPGGHPRGTSDSNAIVLDIKPVVFERLLWVFYNPLISIYRASIPEWTSILELAVHWQFVEVKNLVVRELEEMSMPDIDRIELYQRFEVEKTHLVKYYMQVCTRARPLTADEGAKLGFQTAMTLAAVREEARDSQGNSSSPVENEDEVRKLVCKAFAISAPTLPGHASATTAASTSVGGKTSATTNEEDEEITFTSGGGRKSNAKAGTNSIPPAGQAGKQKTGNKAPAK